MKLHHRVEMPRRLALCSYLAGGAVARQHSQKRKTMGGGTPATTPLGTAGQEVPSMDPLPPPSAGAAGDALLGVADVDIDGGERMDVAAVDAEAVEATAEGSAAGGGAGGGAAGGASTLSDDDGLTYELFSVLVHAGTANAGHYYAYIKDAATGRWFKFNDRRVTSLSVEQLAESKRRSLLRSATAPPPTAPLPTALWPLPCGPRELPACPGSRCAAHSGRTSRRAAQGPMGGCGAVRP